MKNISSTLQAPRGLAGVSTLQFFVKGSNAIRLFAFGLLLTFGLCSIAQNVKSDLLKLNEFYKGKPISTNMRLLIFPTYDSKKIADEYEASYLKTKDGTKSYYKFGENEMVQTEKYSLLVDHAHQTMMIQPVVKPPATDLTSTIDSLLKRSSNVEHSVSGTRVQYSFSFDAGPYPKIDLVFDKSTWMIERLVHYYHQGAYHGAKGITEENAVRSEMVYDNTKFTLEGSKAEQYFSETRFMHLKNGRYATLPDYEAYRLFDFVNLD